MLAAIPAVPALIPFQAHTLIVVALSAVANRRRHFVTAPGKIMLNLDLTGEHRLQVGAVEFWVFHGVAEAVAYNC